MTLGIGLRAALVPVPWQNYLVAAYAGFVGEAFEGLIVDTDHWRHFFLLLGLVWGLTVATINERRRQAWTIDMQFRCTAARGAGSKRSLISEQSAAHRECREPDKPGEAKPAEHRGGPEILDPADSDVLLRPDVVESFSIAVFRNSTANTRRSAPIMATYQARLGATKKAIRIAAARTTISSRKAASVFKAVDQSVERVNGRAIDSLHGAAGSWTNSPAATGTAKCS